MKNNSKHIIWKLGIFVLGLYSLSSLAETHVNQAKYYVMQRNAAGTPGEIKIVRKLLESPTILYFQDLLPLGIDENEREEISNNINTMKDPEYKPSQIQLKSVTISARFVEPRIKFREKNLPIPHVKDDNRNLKGFDFLDKPPPEDE